MEKSTVEVKDYFQQKYESFGAQAKGVDWNSAEAQEIRFDQVLSVIVPQVPYTVLDFGCGYGAMADYMRRKGFNFEHYYGYDIVPEALTGARKQFTGDKNVSFVDKIDDIPQVDYVIASGVFNIKLNSSAEAWRQHIIETLTQFDGWAKRGFSSNFLTSYSDADRMAERPDLYYADPCFLFDYCRRHFARNVALLHDYKIWDFTILVRKEYDI